MGNQLLALRTFQRNFGFSLRPLAPLALFQARALFSAVTLALDNVLYPGFRKVPFDRPIFILGNPRSGTTLMHRFLVRLEPLCGFDLWEMLVPAISARKLLDPLVDVLEARLPPPPHGADIHETGLRFAETDDAFLMFQLMEGPLFSAAIMAWDESFQTEILYEPHPEQTEERIFRALEAVWRRNLYYRGRSRLVVKSSAVSAAIPHLLERFPDARLLYMMRNPLQVIPSCLSLVDNVYVSMMSRIRTPTREQLSCYYENMYEACCLLYRRFHEQRVAGLIPDENLMIVSYRRLMKEFDTVMNEVLDFIDVPRERAAPLIRELTSRQRERKSGHKYTLEQFGLSEARVRKDLDFIFANYDVE